VSSGTYRAGAQRRLPKIQSHPAQCDTRPNGQGVGANHHRHLRPFQPPALTPHVTPKVEIVAKPKHPNGFEDPEIGNIDPKLLWCGG
jgi:hypothetical protein